MPLHWEYIGRRRKGFPSPEQVARLNAMLASAPDMAEHLTLAEHQERLVLTRQRPLTRAEAERIHGAEAAEAYFAKPRQAPSDWTARHHRDGSVTVQFRGEPVFHLPAGATVAEAAMVGWSAARKVLGLDHPEHERA
jgi:hypothetical protein